MIREVDLIAYLPEYLKDYREMQEALKTQEPEIQELWDQVEAMQNNQYILYADQQGIEKFEQMLEIAGKAASVKSRQELIITKSLRLRTVSQGRKSMMKAGK